MRFGRSVPYGHHPKPFEVQQITASGTKIVVGRYFTEAEQQTAYWKIRCAHPNRTFTYNEPDLTKGN